MSLDRSLSLLKQAQHFNIKCCNETVLSPSMDFSFGVFAPGFC